MVGAAQTATDALRRVRFRARNTTPFYIIYGGDRPRPLVTSVGRRSEVDSSSERYYRGETESLVFAFCIFLRLGGFSANFLPVYRLDRFGPMNSFRKAGLIFCHNA